MFKKIRLLTIATFMRCGGGGRAPTCRASFLLERDETKKSGLYSVGILKSRFQGKLIVAKTSALYHCNRMKLLRHPGHDRLHFRYIKTIVKLQYKFHPEFGRDFLFLFSRESLSYMKRLRERKE